jgi:hypothetical protein
MNPTISSALFQICHYSEGRRVIFNGNCGFLCGSPFTVGLTMNASCQTISLFDEEKTNDSRRRDSTTSENVRG